MRHFLLWFVLGMSFSFAACDSEQETANTGALLPKNRVQYHLIAAGEFQNKIRVRGFSECTPPGTTVDLKV